MTSATTVYIDASPLPSTPSGLPAIPSGSFSLPLQNPTKSLNSCLLDDSQLNAWGCIDGASVQLDISPDQQVSLSSGIPQNLKLKYGAQPPCLDRSAGLKLMADKDDNSRGPAWFFQQPYNKVVIVRENLFGQPAEQKRWLNEIHEDEHSEPLESRNYFGRHSTTKPTDKPWFCYWNETILEGFIYATQNSSDSDEPDSSTFIPASWPNAPSAIPSIPYPTSQPPKRRDFSQVNPDKCPKVIKLEELPNPNSSFQPFCQQMQIMNDGTPQPLPGPDGGFIIVNITTNQPGGSSNRLKRGIAVRNPTSNACACEWTTS